MTVSFNEAFKDKTAKNPKVPKSEYKESGDIPVIDQGKNFISGYTSSDNQMVSTSLPVILFGDHTKAVKYVDTPFALGADGVKVLEPQPGFLPKYLYWQLKDSKLPDAGYSRHFKFLKGISIEKPPLEEQEKFVKIRDLQFSIQRKRERQQELFIEFERAVFNQKYSRAQQVAKLGDIVEIRSGLVDPTLPLYKDLPHIGPDSIVSGSDEIRGWRTAAEDGVKSGKFLFKKGDILYSKIRPNLNKVAIAQFDGLCSADMYPLITRSDLVDAKYIQMVLSSQEFIAYANSLSNRANIPKLNKNQLLNYTLKI